MNQAHTAPRGTGKYSGKVVYFATGTAAEVATDFARLRLGGNGMRLRVVAPAEFAQQLAHGSRVKPDEVLAYRTWNAPLIWLRLLAFLGLSRKAEVLCLTSPQRFRFLKFLAITLRGRVVFSPVNGARVPLGFLDLAGIWLKQRRDAREVRRKNFPIGVIGSASGYYLEKIVPALRARYPDAPVHGLLLASAAPSTAALFDSVRVLQPGLSSALRETPRMLRTGKIYQRWILPCTDEPYRLLKIMTFFWPLPRRQIYNELADGFPVRNVSTLWRHFRWRLRDRMSFQIVAGTGQRNVALRGAHLVLYGFRLLAAVPLLGLALLRSYPRRWRGQRRRVSAEENKAGGPVWDEGSRSGSRRLAHSSVVAPPLPGEPRGPVGLE
jgi:hypothetical protein